MDELIEENMGLVISIVNAFKPKNALERDEYTQAGRIGLWRALRDHDPNISVISTYAYNPIRWEIIKEIKKHARHTSKAIELIKPIIIEQGFDELTELLPNSLTEEEILVLKLRQSGCTFKEIKTMLSKGSTYTKNLFLSAIEKIRTSNKINV